MLKYKVTRERPSTPIFEFEDKSYALLSEFLLAEGRNFGTEITAFLTQCFLTGQTAEFAGNVFRIKASEGQARIINEITDKECLVPLKELKTIVEEYISS